MVIARIDLGSIRKSLITSDHLRFRNKNTYHVKREKVYCKNLVTCDTFLPNINNERTLHTLKLWHQHISNVSEDWDIIISASNTHQVLADTAAAEAKRPMAQNMMIGMGVGWFFAGLKPYMGMSREAMINSEYNRRYSRKYRKLYNEQQQKQHDEHSH